ncbi:hypothetical protein [Dyadobacter sp. CY323]|uniref:hypothetical protein n=1 Tax=Dyadobacter sp. CY323 TaxID=2907302 RepID=UPI001F2EC47A|nr:hypothetical protein [Dyadobacter sp. CY323]MCE6991870.1 hypothetical protein [Dyadobacter sp. CY323]
MKKLYTLKSALKSNTSGLKCDAFAAPATLKEIKQHKDLFHFDFLRLQSDYIIYKLCVDGQRDKLKGLVGFRPTPGILECANMEAAHSNKRGNPLYSGAGKALIALCCKVSFDLGLEGYIYFDAKNRLIPYYERFGAKLIFGLRMVIEPDAAEALIDLYF